VPVWWWRSVVHSFNAFAVESFIDELTHAAGADPYQFRRDLLTAKLRHLGVLDAVAQASGWSGRPPTGVHRGIAVHESYGSFVADVAEISVGANKELVIHRIVCAVDCGLAVNPDLVKAQMESGNIFGLSAALLGEITVKDGVVEQSNFDDYPVLRVYQTPKIEVHIVDSHEPPSGVGEPGVPCVGPALANAIFAATDERIRSQPLKKHHALHIASGRMA
jgi:isoquinoline 1-oxidoreductase subunit beta